MLEVVESSSYTWFDVYNLELCSPSTCKSEKTHHIFCRVGWDISDHEVRVLAVDSAICLCENSFDLYATLHDILGEISQAYHSLLAVKCYSNFPNAVSHRQRHRLLCLLLSLLSFAAKVRGHCCSELYPPFFLICYFDFCF